MSSAKNVQRGLFDGSGFLGTGIPNSVVGGGAGYLIGGPVGGLIGAEIGGGFDQNSASAKAAKDQMDFQERMANTSYQRGMADMRAAGLNPILAYSQGGAATPSGAMPNVVNPFSGAADKVIASAKQDTNMQMAQAQIANTNANTAAIPSVVNLQQKQADAAAASARASNANAISTLSKVPEAQARGKVGGIVNSLVDTIAPQYGSAFDAAKSVVPAKPDNSFDGSLIPFNRAPVINPAKH